MFLKHTPGVPWWPSNERIQHCHCHGLGHSCGMGSIPGPGTSAYWRCTPPKYIYLCVCTHTHVYTCMHTHTHTPMCVYTFCLTESATNSTNLVNPLFSHLADYYWFLLCFSQDCVDIQTNPQGLQQEQCFWRFGGRGARTLGLRPGIWARGSGKSPRPLRGGLFTRQVMAMPVVTFISSGFCDNQIKE